MNPWNALGRAVVSPGDRMPRVMGVLNLTPDSFSDGGSIPDAEGAVARALTLADDGADLIDLGGESSRPGAEPVTLDEELRRVVPVLEALRGRIGRPISVDTTKAGVARRALGLGAAIVNDITGLRGDPEMRRLLADCDAGVVIMHMPGTPQTMQRDPRYLDVVSEVRDFLARRLDDLEAAGIARDRMAVDPGIGFGKTYEHNVALLRNLDRLGDLGCAVLVGTSRKGFLGTITGRPVAGRATASVVSSLMASARGAGVVRVHDVGPMVDALKVWAALRGDGGEDDELGR